MSEAPLPPDEAARVRALHDLGLLFTPAEERFERITRLAARFLRMPMTLISLLDSSVAWFKAVHGVRATEVPRALSFCAYAILGVDTLVVPDTLEDPRFRDNPARHRRAVHPLLRRAPAPAAGRQQGGHAVRDGHPAAAA